ncbi:hypothetical protein [uncultured Fibrobacter sp.]|uniref:RipA family octameric membrane protein n=1 Tax=uncultured Fibrobacter sp. TaxID=261512 RepID=UPI0028064A82|nr:hypothetical protein [uncultured Fibrobacter sp.]
MKLVLSQNPEWMTKEEYRKRFGMKDSSEPKQGNNDISSKPNLEKAYEVACETRKFEIELYWKRAGYFWAFITTIYVAYYHVLVNAYCKEFGHFPLLVLSGMGLFFTVAWILAAKGSKHWQENWEAHVSLLEDGVTGPLYKIYKPKSYSVSKINLCAGYVTATCAGELYVFEIGAFCQRLATNFPYLNPFILFLILFILSSFGILTFVIMVRGCSEKEKLIKLKERKIES